MDRNVNRKKRRRYRGLLFLVLTANLFGIAFYYYLHLESRVPGHIFLYENRIEQMDFNVPVKGKINIGNSGEFAVNGKKTEADAETVSFSLDQPVSLTAGQRGSYQADLKLFGLIPYKKVQVDVIQEQKVMPSGEAVGIYLESQGIMVLGTADIRGEDGFIYHPAKNILQAGDYLLSINGKAAENISQVSELLQDNGEKRVTLQLMRGNNKIRVKVDPVCTEQGTYQIGVWLREDTEGIGTMTCVREDGTFAALGHGITDIDTGLLIQLQEGGLYPAKVKEVVAGKKGTPGELSGSVLLQEQEKIGEVTKNSSWGISGQIQSGTYQYQSEKGISIGLKQEIHKGKATIRCQLGEGVKEYEIQIEKINWNTKDQKGLVLRVTDPELLKKTGGIVQGMSGSPILQDGKLVGAVTHVFVDDPTRGYGIFIENMLEAAVSE